MPDKKDDGDGPGDIHITLPDDYHSGDGPISRTNGNGDLGSGNSAPVPLRSVGSSERELGFELFKTHPRHMSLVSDVNDGFGFLSLLQPERSRGSASTSSSPVAQAQGIHHIPSRASVSLLGTASGVFMPCLQNILGVILFIRLSWIVGQAGVLLSLVIVAMCCTCTFLTGLSLSAVATNGAMRGGGPYYLIGRALGPEVGTSIGICFYLGTTIATSMYILGGVETFFNAMPSARIFTDASLPSSQTQLDDMRLIGCVVAFLIVGIVAAGTRNVARIGPLFLVPVLVSVLCILLGLWTAASRRGDVPRGVTGLSGETFQDNLASAFVRTDSSGEPRPYVGKEVWNFQALLALFFPSVTGIMAGSNRSATLRDPQRSIPVGTLSAIGVTSALYIFFVLMYGGAADRSVLLHERILSAEVSWPEPSIVRVGIILSTLGAALQSLTSAPRLLQAMANDGLLPILKALRTEDSAEPRKCLLVTFVITVAGVLIGRLDLITPIITQFFLMCYFGVNAACFLLDFMRSPNWRPRWRFHSAWQAAAGAALCVIIMVLISWLFTLVAMLLSGAIYLYVAAYGSPENWGDGLKNVRYRSAVTSITHMKHEASHPKNWYPSPLILCKPWGLLPDSVPCHPKLISFASMLKIKGMGLSMIYSIIEGDYSVCADEAYEASKVRVCRHLCIFLHTYNSRHMAPAGACSSRREHRTHVHTRTHTSETKMCERPLVDKPAPEMCVCFCSLCMSLLYTTSLSVFFVFARLLHVQELQAHMEDQGCEGFAQVVVAPSMRDGVRGLLQSAGLGGLTPNLLVLRYPERWRSISDVGVNLHSKFTGVLQDAFTSGKGIVLIADADKLPHAKDKATVPISPDNTPATIDLYWVVRDGGLMLLLAQVLMRSSPFRRCAMRVFVVSECADKSEPLRQDVKRFLYELRIDAEVVVLEMDGLDEKEEEPEGFDEYKNFILEGSSHAEGKDDAGLHNDDAGDTGRNQHRGNGKMNGTHATSPSSSSSSSSTQRNGGGPFGLLRSKSLDSPRYSVAQNGVVSLSDAQLRRIDRSIRISLKINRLIRSHSCSSSPASIVLVSLPPPPENHPPRNYMTYLDALIHGISTPLLLVRGYRRAVVTLYT